MIAPQLIRFVESVPGLDRVLADVARTVYNYAADNEVDELNPVTFISPEGKMVVDLLGAITE